MSIASFYVDREKKARNARIGERLLLSIRVFPSQLHEEISRAVYEVSVE